VAKQAREDKAMTSTHTTQIWQHHAGLNMTKAQQAQLAAEVQCDTSRKAHIEAGHNNLGMYGEVTDSLEKKVQTSHNLLEALRWRAGILSNSLMTLRQSLAKLETAMLAKEAPLKFCMWHIEERKARPRRELVRDIVEEHLEEEKATIMDTQRKLSDATRRTKSRISDLEAKLQEVRQDIDNKTQAVGLDEMCLRSANGSFNTVLMHTERPLSAGRTAKYSKWKRPDDHPALRESRNNELVRERKVAYLVGATEKQDEGVKSFCEDQDRLIIQCARSVEDAATRAEQAVQVRLKENQDMRFRLERELKETEAKIDATMNTISETRFQITALEEPVELAGLCGSWRNRRTDPERISDPVSTRFQDHSAAAVKARRELVLHQQSIHSKLQHLQECRDHLAEDIADKLTAYNIDQHCLSNRSMQPTHGGIEAIHEPPFVAPPLRSEYLEDTTPLAQDATSRSSVHSLPGEEQHAMGLRGGSVYSVPRSEFHTGSGVGGSRLPSHGATMLSGTGAAMLHGSSSSHGGHSSVTPSGASTPVSIRSGRGMPMANGTTLVPPHGSSTPSSARSRHSQAGSSSGDGLVGIGGAMTPRYPLRPATREGVGTNLGRTRYASTSARPVTAS